jgi:hypothetical protein
MRRNSPLPVQRYEALAEGLRDFYWHRLPNLSKSERTLDDVLRDWGKEHGLEFLGSGFHRKVFRVPEGVLKVSTHLQDDRDYGNLSEAKAWEEAPPEIRKHLVPVLGVAPNGSWLLAEYAPYTGRERTPKEEKRAEAAWRALTRCGVIDLRGSNFADDGRVLDYGSFGDRARWQKCISKPSRKARANPKTARRNPYEVGKKYSGAVPEVRYLPVSVIYRREYDFKPEALAVSDTVARSMDYSVPVDVTAFRFSDGGIAPTVPPRRFRPEDEDDDTSPMVLLEDGHHRLAAAVQTGRAWLPVNLRAVNAKGEKLNALIALSQQIEAKAPQSNPKTARRTHPSLWSRIVAEVTASGKGGLPGQWSARKAQFAVAEYQRRGGGYIGPKTPDNALAKWTREQWRTRSGLPSLVTGERYLPKRAIAALTAAEYAETSAKKRAGMRRGQQFIPQPERIAMKTARFRRNPDTDVSHYFSPAALAEAEKVSKALKSKDVLVYLTPAEFLAMAKPGHSAQKAQNVANVLREGLRFDDVPHLNVGYDATSGVARVTGHEGRHRAKALQALGVERLPVLLRTQIRWSDQTRPKAFDYVETLPYTLVSEDGAAQMAFPLPVHYPEVHARMTHTRRNPRARRNPNYDDVSVYRGVLTSPEGRIPVKQIGKGQFSVAYLSSEPRPRVFLFTSEEVQDKEILMFAHDRLPNNPHLPAVEQYGHARDGRTVWTMPLYKAPLKKADNEQAWKQYIALKKCREALYRPKGVKSGYQVNYDVYECAVAAGVSPKLANALEHLISTAADYDEEYVFEFSPRNLATDAEGNLVLLDVLYHRRALFRALGAAAKKGF